MRITFAGEEAAKKRAKLSLETNAGMLRRWFVRKYGLPTTHEAYTAQSDGEWLEELYADLYAEQKQVLYNLEHLSASGAAPKEQEAERRKLTADLQRIATALGEAAPGVVCDPVLDDIEARMARGETDIDLSALLPKGWKPPPQ